MTEKEWLTTVKGLKTVYPNESFLANQEAIAIWYRLLSDLDYNAVNAAVQKHICTSKFPPTIADIREACNKFAMVNRKDWLEGWSMITKYIGKYGYYQPREAIAALKEFDETTGRVAELLGWQNLCMSENPAADRANFRQVYETTQQREAESMKLPDGVRGMISAVAQRMQLGDGHDREGE